MTTRRLHYNATIVNRVDLTDVLSIFQIEPDELPDKRPWFAAGQYCVLGLNNVERPELGSVCRPMSIASPPEIDHPLEFYIRRVAQAHSTNPLTHLLWKLTKGDRVFVLTRAAGALTMERTIGVNDPRMRVLVAAGTGIAPFVSMIRSEVRRNLRADLAKWVLLHGCSRPSDLGYRKELLELSAANGLKYWASISRPGEAPYWQGDVGRIEMFFERMRLADLESRVGLDAGGFTPSKVVVYVCGGTGTIYGTIVRLVDRGFIPAVEEFRKALAVPREAENSLFLESYDTGSVINVSALSTTHAFR